MDPRYSAEAEAYRHEVQRFLDATLDRSWQGIGALDEASREAFLLHWRTRLVESRLLAVHWPTAFGGGGLSTEQMVVVAEEFARRGVPQSPLATDPFGIGLLGNTVLRWGTDTQQEFFLPRIVSGEHRWCQGYSETEAGSDLAALRTQARLDGDEWVIDGHKVWTTIGHLANWIFVLARTDPASQRHHGISFLLVPMDQPGVEVRPIRMITGDAEFNEVFFDGARTAAENVVGGVDNGWAVAMTLLGFERAASEASTAILFRGEFERLADLARARGLADDPVIRQRLAACFTRVQLQRFSGMRSLSRALRGDAPGAESSMAKVYGSEYHQEATNLAMDLLGMEATTPGGLDARSALGPQALGTPNSSRAWGTVFLGSRAGTIYGGSSQIQRNVLGERVLGLPR